MFQTEKPFLTDNSVHMKGCHKITLLSAISVTKDYVVTGQNELSSSWRWAVQHFFIASHFLTWVPAIHSFLDPLVKEWECLPFLFLKNLGDSLPETHQCLFTKHPATGWSGSELQWMGGLRLLNKNGVSTSSTQKQVILCISVGFPSITLPRLRF